MDNSQVKLIEECRRQMNLGEYQGALETLRPLIEHEVPEALFLYSMFSVHGTESELEFERRSMRLLRRAAELGHAPAQCALAGHLENGDLGVLDPSTSADLYKRAAMSGHIEALFRHGLNTYYGSNGIAKSSEEGIALIGRAATEGSEDAQAFMRDRA